MQYKKLGQTDLDVSLICLGTMTFGEQNSQEDAFKQLDYATEHGVNFIDTAELYPVPPNEHTVGLTETYIGKWIAERKNRDKIILASKVAGAGEWLPHIRGKQRRLDKSNIIAALDESLKKLNTDYIDLYQVHWPDRSTNFFGKLGYEYPNSEDATPIEDTLDALNACVKAGKIRHIGISNETPWGTAEYLRLADKKGLPRIQSIQNPYNLLNRSFEVGLAEFSHRSNTSLLAYSPLGFGVLSGKYLGGKKPDKARLTLFDHFSRYSHPAAVAATEKYVALAREHSLDPAQMALAFINQQPFTTSNIIGATCLDQLKANIESVHISLSDDVISGIQKIHHENPNPCP